ncbi:MAG: class I SAM-dependent methyltransferase [Prochlorococcus marinus XMU1428]|nr:class I SAM-dependent methyltransferase [Prochlorococcus marinus XMU1428]
MSNFTYEGSELNVFSKAKNFKRYYYELAKNYISYSQNVLELGAGIGSQTLTFSSKVNFSSWTCIEPDKNNFHTLKSEFSHDKRFSLIRSSIDDFQTDKKFDLILLADVLEHIPNDSSALNYLLSLLSDNGILLVYVPACQFLFSTFDSSIGHFRRYSIPTLMQIIPPKSSIKCIKYFDSVGFILSLLNKLFLKSASPSLKQILFWDRIVVPLSNVFDKLLNYKFGKNIFCVIKNV